MLVDEELVREVEADAAERIAVARRLLTLDEETIAALVGDHTAIAL